MAKKVESWKEFAPFDAIIITSLAKEIPTLLLSQLKNGGRMILPLELATGEQYLVLINKLTKDKIETKMLIQVRFVPLL